MEYLTASKEYSPFLFKENVKIVSLRDCVTQLCPCILSSLFNENYSKYLKERVEKSIYTEVYNDIFIYDNCLFYHDRYILVPLVIIAKNKNNGEIKVFRTNEYSYPWIGRFIKYYAGITKRCEYKTSAEMIRMFGEYQPNLNHLSEDFQKEATEGFINEYKNNLREAV